MTITIYHNPRCSKSRQTLELIQDKEPTIIEYLKTPPTADEIKSTVAKLGVSVRDIIRIREEEYKANGLDNMSLSDDEIYSLLAKFPKLIERPIVIKGDKARIGRPPESVLDIL